MKSLLFFYENKTFGKTYNLVFERLAEEIVSGYLLEYEFESNFLRNFTNFQVDEGDFRGVVYVKPISAFAKLLQKNSEDCFRVIFDNPYSSPSEGSGGVVGSPDGKPSSNPNFGTIYGPHGPSSTSDGDSGSSGGGGGSSNDGPSADPCLEEWINKPVKGPNGWESRWVFVSTGDCDGNGINDEDEEFTSDVPTETTNKNLSSNCQQILSEIGVLFRPIPNKITDEEIDLIDFASNELPYNVNALYSFLDVATLQSCIGNETASSACIRAQVKEYIKGQVRTINNGGIGYAYEVLVENIDDDNILADFFHALYGSSGNSNMVEASRYALENLASPAMQGDLVGQLMHLGLASEAFGESFRSNAPAVSNIASRLCETLSSSGFRFLLNSPDVLNGISDFLEERGNSEEAEGFADFAIGLLREDEEYKWERLKELNELLENDPEALVSDCFPSIEEWQDLVNFRITGVPARRIRNSNGTWDVQTIERAKGAVINLDHYTVAVEEFPFVNGSSGRRMSPQELFDHFRININDFAPKFNPYDDPYDVNLWNSDNPLGAVMEIEIQQAFGIVDLIDGDVICSQFENCCWVFTTLNGSPLYNGSGFHPVSGNRQFGYSFENGVFKLHIRGADRTTEWHYGGIGNNGGMAYEQGDLFWRGAQAKFAAFVNDNGGVSGRSRSDIVRPVWEEVKALLKLNSVITRIPCPE
ncbi:hypothetical protein [Neolewinella agarilytica]|uniref:hypothetical protein n=1 Tax=Neolewinella agarilytica TaxID=478744 RepID=UPI00235597E1|nr:hypothetical protein [Neolewinella agarilytica]